MNAKLPRGTLEKLWSDPANWRINSIYVCKDDPRYLVPKRVRWAGWTVNFARKGAWIYFVGGIALTIAAAYAGILADQPAIVAGTILLIIIVSVFVARWQASPSRFEEHE
jgi:hypothetical protein